MPKDFYDLLGVSDDAPTEDIESAYRSKVREYHPDRNDSPDATDKFKTIQKAKEILTNDKERYKYDQIGHDRYVRSYVRGGLDGFTFTGRTQYDGPMGTPTPSPSEKKPSSSSSTRTSSPKMKNTASTTQRTSTQTTTDSKSTETQESTESDIHDLDPDDIPFKPKVHPRIKLAVTAVLLSTFAYVYGILAFLGSNEANFMELFRDIQANPWGIFHSEAILQSPLEFMVAAIDADPITLVGSAMFPIGAVLIPGVLAHTVWTLGGRKSTWMYVLGTLPPLAVILVSSFSIWQPPLQLSIVLYTAIPVATVILFITDIMGHIIYKYIEFYIEFYNIGRFFPG